MFYKNEKKTIINTTHTLGPAGGVVGYAMTSYSQEDDLPVIGFDMGGTSTDVSRYAGTFPNTETKSCFCG